MLLQAAGLAGIAAVTTSAALLIRVHVRALLTFDADGERTKPPEELTPTERLRVLVQGARIPRPQNTRTPEAVGFTFETHIVEVPDGTRLEVWTVPGGKKQVVLFHGYAAQKDQVLDGIPWFAARGYTVHLVDFRASGGSTGSRTTLGAEEADDVEAVLRWASGRSEGPLVAYGFSMGGAALLGALGRAELRVTAAIVDGVFDRLSTTLAHRFRSVGVPATPGRELLMLMGSVELRRSAWKVAPMVDARSVPIPVLVVNGENDPRVHPGEAKNIHDALAKGELLMLAGGGHLPGFEGCPEQWDPVVHDFLRRHT